MPFNLLLLPLLGGYIFLTHWNRTRFSTKRYSGERLIFRSAIAGVLFLAASYLIVRFIVLVLPTLLDLWLRVVPFPNAGTSFGAFLLGSTVWWPLNQFWFPHEVEQRRVIAEWGDYLEELFERSMRHTKQVAITMKNGKVYAGFVLGNINPSYDRKYLKILPISSGYRELANQTVTFTTDYAAVYDEIAEEAEMPDGASALAELEDFQIVLPLAEIASANIFDPDAYVRFTARRPNG